MRNPMAVLIGALTLAAIGYGCEKAEAPTAPTAAKTSRRAYVAIAAECNAVLSRLTSATMLADGHGV